MNGEKIKRIEFSTRYVRSLKKLSEEVKREAREKEIIFRQNPLDSRLKTHKLSGKFKGYWSYSVNYKNRVIFRFINDREVLFFNIGLHPIYGGNE